MNKQLFIFTLFVASMATFQLNGSDGARSDSPPPMSELATDIEDGRLSSPPMSEEDLPDSPPMTDSDDDRPPSPLRPAIPPAFPRSSDLAQRSRSN